ncbi:MAG: AAA family ATPase [Actinomycetota bacterium]
MTTPNRSTLSQLLASITPHSSEEDVENHVIVPLLHILGYSQQDWQHQTVISKIRLDFRVHPPDAATSYPPYLVIETKAAYKTIAHTSWQINRYLRKSGAILGLLTNGYQFRILYNYNNQVETIIEYSQIELINNFKLFKNILSKTTCLKVSQAFYNSQQRIHLQFASFISKSFANEAMLGLFKKKQNQVDSGNSANQVEATTVESNETSLIDLEKQRKSMIVTVFNNKGGVGKTTLTINLGATLSQMGKRVLLIDVDAQANLTTGLGIDPLVDVEEQGKKDVTHLLLDPRTKLEETIIRKTWGGLELDIVPSHIRLSRKETELNGTVGIDQVLEKKLKNHPYDFIFIDPPPSFGRVNGIALMASSGILIPTQLSAYPIRALEYVLERIQEIEQLKPIAVLGIAVSMYDQRSSGFNTLMTQKLCSILQRLELNNIPLFPETTWIPRLNIVSLCQEKGYPIQQAEFDRDMKSQEKEAAQKLIERYEELAQYLIKITEKEL